MDTGKQTSKAAVRSAMQALGKDGQEIGYRLLYEVLGLENEAQQAIVRSRISDMVRHGEVRRTRVGCFVYDFRHRPHEAKGYEAIWRFVRAAKPGWSVSECALMTRHSYTLALRYCNWLEGQGYIQRVGRNSRRAITWRATLKADQHPETPYPPLRRGTDPFEKERSAAATITRLMLCADPNSRHTARRIVEAAHTLLARFEERANTVTELENA